MLLQQLLGSDVPDLYAATLQATGLQGRTAAMVVGPL